MNLVDDAEARDMNRKKYSRTQITRDESRETENQAENQIHNHQTYIEHMENIFYPYIWWPVFWRFHKMPPQKQNNLDTIQCSWIECRKRNEPKRRKMRKDCLFLFEWEICFLLFAYTKSKKLT